jgi:hypothetical protein
MVGLVGSRGGEPKVSAFAGALVLNSRCKGFHFCCVLLLASVLLNCLFIVRDAYFFELIWSAIQGGVLLFFTSVVWVSRFGFWSLLCLELQLSCLVGFSPESCVFVLS